MKQDMATALFNGYLSLVRVLHRNGSLNVSDLTNDLGNTIDFRRSHGVESAEDHEIFEILYQAVQQLERHEAKHAEMQALLEQAGKTPPSSQ